MDFAVLADYGHRVVSRAHLAGAGYVLRSGHLAEQVLVQRLVGGQLGVRGFYALLDDVVECRALSELDAEAHRLTQPLQVEGVLQVAVVQERLLGRVRRN